MNSFDYLRAASVEEASAEINENPGARIVAGGTNLLDLWKYDLVHPDLLVDIHHAAGNSDIAPTDDGGLLLGALATNAETAYHPLVEKQYPLLSRAILAGASAQIRNMATNGGNLLQRTRCYYFYDAALPCNKRVPGSGCPAITGHNRIHAILGTSPACIAVFPSDMCVALAALDATVLVHGPEGKRSIPFDEFHRLPGDTPELDNNLQRGEIITGIRLPARGFAGSYSYLKLRERHSYAFALVSVATGLELHDGRIRDARIALGGVAHKPWRVREAEALLTGQAPEPAAFEAAAARILEGARTFGHNDFKPELARRAIVRNCMMALDPASQRPGAKPSC